MTLPVLALLISTILSLAIIVFSWERRSMLTARTMGLLSLAMALTCWASAFQLSSSNLYLVMFWIKVSSVGALLIAPAWLVFVLSFTGSENLLTLRFKTLLLAVPILLILLNWTNDLHGLLGTNFRLVETGLLWILKWDKGILYWLEVGYVLLVSGSGLYFLARFLRPAALKQRVQTIMLIISGVLPWGATLLMLFNPTSDLEYTSIPLAVLASTAFWMAIVFELRIFDIVPIAWEMVVESMNDAVLILNNRNLIINLNPMASELLEQKRGDLIGKRLSDLSSNWLGFVERYARDEEHQESIAYNDHIFVTHYDLILKPLYDPDGRLMGRLLVLKDITQKVKTEEALRASESRFRSLVEQSLIAISLTDEQGRCIEWNSANEQVTGIPRELAMGKNLVEIQRMMTPGRVLYPEQEMRLHALAKQALKTGKSGALNQPEQLVIQRTDGEIRYIEQVTFCIRTEKGWRLGSATQDVTERRQAEDHLIMAQRDLYHVINSNPDGMLVTNNDGKILFANPAAEDLWGSPMDELLGQSFEPALTAVGAKEITLARKDKSRRIVEVCSVDTEWKGLPARLATLRDVTRQKEVEQRLRYMSSHDFLTGLYNRIYYSSEISRLEDSCRYPFSLVMLDANGLKKINDTQGHTAGDQFLRRISEFLQQAFNQDEIVARIGGDEFAIILPNTGQEKADSIMMMLKLRIWQANREHPNRPISVSFGVATLTGAGQMQQALALADKRMYEDKKRYYEQTGDRRHSG